MSVIFDEGALHRLLTGPQSEIARDLARKAVAVESAAKQIATADGLVNTGRYRASISWRIGADGLGLFADVGSKVGYASYIEHGTRPHIIEARRKKALYWRGADHPVRLVHHPGTPARHVLRRALFAVLGR